MTDARSEFLAGERPEDVVLFLAEGMVDGPEKLEEYGERTDDGLVLVMDGEMGRRVFKTATEMDAMTFAGKAMGTEGEIDPDLSGAICPKRDEIEDEHDHRTRFVFAFLEEQQTSMDGLVAEGDTVFAYAHCTCGAAYSDRWHAGER